MNLHEYQAKEVFAGHGIPIIPGMAEAMQAAYEAGAAAVALSGAGPSLIAFAAGEYDRISNATVGAFKESGVSSRQWQLTLDNAGILIRKDS